MVKIYLKTPLMNILDVEIRLMFDLKFYVERKVIKMLKVKIVVQKRREIRIFRIKSFYIKRVGVKNYIHR